MTAVPVTVAVPGEGASLRVLRLVASDVGRRLGFRYDKIEETRLAVNEAASMLLQRGSDRIICRLTPTDDGVSVYVASAAPQVGWPPDGWSSSLEHLVLSRIVSDLELHPETAISFTLRGN